MLDEPVFSALASLRLESALPVRSFFSWPGKRNYEGSWWSSTTCSHVGFGSLLERDFLMLADSDRNVAGIASQPFAVLWPKGTEGARGHVPDFILRLSDGGGRVVDVRHQDHLEAGDRQFFPDPGVVHGFHVGTPAMLAASECAGAGIALSTLEERRVRAEGNEYEMLVYPETVKIARLITCPAFKDWIQNPARPTEQRRDRIASEIARTLFRTSESQRRRAAQRIESALRRLSRRGIEWLA